MQKRLKKYSRNRESFAALASRRITDTSLAIIATIHDYRIIPTSLLVRLVDGNEKNIQRQLQQLYHKGLVNRFTFMRGRNPSEFHYYLDNTAALALLLNRGVERESLAFDEVRRNREKAYCAINDPKHSGEMQGLFLMHEVMISRFHAMLELACRQSDGHVELSDFQQGPTLWHKVEVPKLAYRNGGWQELDQTEQLPHRPDAFFTLSFPNEGGREPLHFFYEADRHRTDRNKYNKKLRAYFHFVVKQKQRLQEIYGLNRIRAVLTETVDDEWAEKLRQAANDATVSGPKPSPLFWFTTSRLFTDEIIQEGGQTKRIPTYLHRPDIILKRVWASPVDDTLHSLVD